VLSKKIDIESEKLKIAHAKTGCKKVKVNSIIYLAP
jgi:hypothetical protein